jgi:hypothetical protein
LFAFTINSFQFGKAQQFILFYTGMMRFKRIIKRVVIIIPITAAAAMAVLWLIAMPPRNLPKPTGNYRIGTVSYDLTDEGRSDPYAEVSGNPPGPRTIRIQIWYPAVSSDNVRRRSPWMPDGIRQIRGIVKTHDFPPFVWDHTLLMKSNSFQGAEPAAHTGSGSGQPWPIIIISHGWEGYRGLHADLAEELASHGYLVAAADHSYGSAATLLGDGRLLQSSAAVLPEREVSPDFASHASLLVQTFADDNRFILDHLSRIAQGSSQQGPETLGDLTGLLDTSRIGLLGHSTGGGAMVRLVLDLAEEERKTGSAPHIAALIGLDAWVEPVGSSDLLSGEYQVPSLFLRSAQWEGGINDSYLLPFVESLRSPVALYQIEGITHSQFSTLYMYAPVVKWLGLLGSTDARGFMEYQRQQVLRVFDHTCKGEAYLVPEYAGLEKIYGNIP